MAQPSTSSSTNPSGSTKGRVNTGTDPGPVVVGVDGGRASKVALAYVAQMMPGSPVRGVHVLTPDAELVRDLPPFGLTSWRVKVDEAMAGPWIEPAQTACSLEGCVIEADTVAAGLNGEVERTGATLVVIGPPSREGAARRLLGSVAGDLLDSVNVPVLIVPEEAAP